MNSNHRFLGEFRCDVLAVGRHGSVEAVARIVAYCRARRSTRQPLYMLLVIGVSPFTQGSQQEAPAGQ